MSDSEPPNQDDLSAESTDVSEESISQEAESPPVSDSEVDVIPPSSSDSSAPEEPSSPSEGEAVPTDAQTPDTPAPDTTTEATKPAEHEAVADASESSTKPADHHFEDDEEDDEDDILEKPIGSDEGGSPAWITTFADLMSLLMCFFVMLLSMSSLEMTTYKEMVQSMKEGFGLSSGDVIENVSAEEIVDEAAVLQAAAKMKTRKDAANLREVLRDEVQDGLVEVEEGDQLITIQILQAGSFSAGSADLKDSFGEVAERIRGAIKGITGAISITGHTDDSPISTQRFRSNWELSSARAYSVMHALFQGQELDETRFVLRGLAETRPRVPNDSPANRAKNRRVEIVIDQRDESLKNINLARGTGQEAGIDRIVINSDNIDSFTKDVLDPATLRLKKQNEKPAAPSANP